MEKEAELKTWLKRLYREAPASGPDAKRVKFSHVKDELQCRCPSMSVSTQSLSRAISAQFPNAETKQLGKARQSYVLGVDRMCDEEEPSTSITSRSTNSSQEIAELQRQICLLQKKVDELEQQQQSTKTSQLNEQMSRLLCPDLSVFHGPNTVDHFHQFSVDAVIAELQSNAPDLYELFTVLGQSSRHSEADNLAKLSQLRVMSSLTTLLKCRSVQALGVQLLLTFMLIARSTSKQAITVLNHMGVCTSYTTAWKYLKQLTHEGQYLDMIRSGHWMWVYDNLNLQQRIRHEREDCHSSMMNVTSRLAIRIKNLPDFDFSWSDKTPQRPRESITFKDVSLSESDARAIRQRAVRFLMGFLVKAFPSLHDLEEFVPEHEHIHPIKKSEVVPMKLLLKDEKYKSETIDILTQLYNDANLSGDHQVIVGDQLTCKVIRGSKVWRTPEPDPKDKFTWANETPGDFHFLWECLKVIFMIFWEPHRNQGFLSNMRDKINRKQVDKGVKVFNVGDEFLLHTFKAHLAARICTLLKLKSVSDVIPHERSLQWLETTAETLLPQTLMPAKSSDPVYAMHRSFLHTTFLYIDLRSAIRYENGPHIVRLWKAWLPRFVGTGRKNYAGECVHMIACLCADFPRHIAYIATHNRTVNMEGKPGRGKPIDQLIEHYNLVIKETMRGGGGNITKSHAEDVSLSAFFLLDASKKVDREFFAHQSAAHTVRDANRDISMLTSSLLESSVTSENPDRTSPPFNDPTDIGHKKIGTTSWVADTLASHATEDLEKEVGEQQLVDALYELSDNF